MVKNGAKAKVYSVNGDPISSKTKPKGEYSFENSKYLWQCPLVRPRCGPSRVITDHGTSPMPFGYDYGSIKHESHGPTSEQ